MDLTKLAAEIAAIRKMVEDFTSQHSACPRPSVESSYTPPQTTQTITPVSPAISSNPHATAQLNVSQISAKFPPKIIQWANAIKHWEGSIDATNPGNMKYSSLTASWGATRGRLAKDGGNFAIFKNPQAGLDALCHFLVLACEDELQSYHNARTLDAFTTIYAGNPPIGYKQGIANMMGVPLTINIASFLV